MTGQWYGAGEGKPSYAAMVVAAHDHATAGRAAPGGFRAVVSLGLPGADEVVGAAAEGERVLAESEHGSTRESA